MSLGHRLSAAVVWAALVVWPFPQVVLAQPRPVEAPGHREWVIADWLRQSDGLPQDRITAIVQTRDGYLWVGTRGGPARFDGVRFTTWKTSRPTDPPEGEVYGIAEQPDGTVWLAIYGGGLVRYKSGQFAAMGRRDGLLDDYARAVLVDHRGAVWVGSDKGVNRLQAGRITAFQEAEGLGGGALRVLFEDPSDRTLYAGTEQGLFRFVNERFERVQLPAPHTQTLVDRIAIDARGRMWLATRDGLLCRHHSGWTAYGPEHGLSSRTIRSVFCDSGGRLWISTDRSVDLGEEHDGVWRFGAVIADADGSVITEDAEENIWVGFRGNGLVRLQRSQFAVYDRTAGMASSGVTTVFEARGGTIWAGAGTALNAITGERIWAFGSKDGLPEGRFVSSLEEDETGRLWVGTEGGLYRSVGPATCSDQACPVRFVAVGTHTLFRSHVRVVKQRDATSMIVGSNGDGAWEITSDGSNRPPRQLVSGEVRGICVESPDCIWIGTRGDGLYRWTPNGTTQYLPRDGLPHDNVQSLFRDATGTMWIATRRGLAWLSNGRILGSVNTSRGLPENHIFGIADDGADELWLASGSGLFTLLKSELLRGGSSDQPLTIAAYGLEHGLPSAQSAMSHDPVIIRSSSRRIWAATLGGAVSTDPTRRPRTVAAPRVLLESVSLNERTDVPAESHEARLERGRLAFRYTAPAFVAPEVLAFRYHLDGVDPQWVEAGDAREARYTNVPPGTRRFSVQARHGNGSWGASTVVTVRLVPRFYQRSWFPALVGVGVIGVGAWIGWGLHRVRVRNLRQHEQELARRVEDAVAQIKVLSGLLPICAWCKRVRDDAGYWTQMEAYIREHSQAEFSHGLCPDCLREHFPDDAESDPAKGPGKA